MKRTVFKAVAMYSIPNSSDRKEEVIRVQLWQGDGGGSFYSLGQQMTMSESTYISFMHTFNAIHVWKELEE